MWEGESQRKQKLFVDKSQQQHGCESSGSTWICYMDLWICYGLNGSVDLLWVYGSAVRRANAGEIGRKVNGRGQTGVRKYPRDSVDREMRRNWGKYVGK
jgi:hypothetical protein|eukprot:5702479-Prymnesium_polylepis.1